MTSCFMPHLTACWRQGGLNEMGMTGGPSGPVLTSPAWPGSWPRVGKHLPSLRGAQSWNLCSPHPNWKYTKTTQRGKAKVIYSESATARESCCHLSWQRLESRQRNGKASEWGKGTASGKSGLGAVGKGKLKGGYITGEGCTLSFLCLALSWKWG